MNKNLKSPQFRYVNGLRHIIQFGEDEVILAFGYKDDMSDMTDAIVEDVAISMTPSSAKLMALSLLKMVESYERMSETVLPIKAEKLAKLEQSIQDSERRFRQATATSSIAP